MIRAKHSPDQATAERRALRRRVMQMYGLFNRERWQECFALIDPKLRDASKVELPVYARGLKAFREVYGAITPWYIRINLHLEPAVNKRDPRPFAYVYAVWQDSAHRFHMFRERWVKEAGGWFTRVAGLVANQQAPANSE